MNALDLLDHRDLDWVSAVVDVVERCADRPWRDALDRLDDLQRFEQPAAPRRFSAVVAAIQRLTGGRAKNTRAAREARSLVLGHPALSEAERHARIIAAADKLCMTAAAFEKLLWSDLPRERPVELPHGRPMELEVAAFANVAILQRAFRRAQAVTLRMVDDPGPLLRACNQRGLLATALVASPQQSAAVTPHMTELVIVGPLALFHRTSVYGRALADLVPLLGELTDFELEAHIETSTAMYSTKIRSPILLPSPPPRLSAVPYLVSRLTRALERRASGLAITCVPPPIVAGSSILCPDLSVERGSRRCYVELVGFWTVEYVQRKLAAYREGGHDALLCLDASGARVDDDPPRDVLLFRKHPDADEIIEHLQYRWGTLCG